MEEHTVLDCNYVVINTGYTARLVDSHKEKFFKKIHERYYEKHCLDDLDEAEVKETMENLGYINMLFVFDEQWGDGLYKMGDDKEIYQVIDILKKLGKYESGIACFKCNLNNHSVLNKVVLDSTYCNVFEIIDTKLIISDCKDAPIIMLCEYDTESG